MVEEFYAEVNRRFDKSKKSCEDTIINYDRIYEWQDGARLSDDVKEKLLLVAFAEIDLQAVSAAVIRKLVK